MCRKLKRTPAQIMLSLLHEVQIWAGEAGFGKLQRACRFNPSVESDNGKIVPLLNRMLLESGQDVSLPFGKMPIYTESFETELHPNHTIGRRKKVFEFARTRRVLSMAATGRSDKGISVTYPNSNSRIKLLR